MFTMKWAVQRVVRGGKSGKLVMRKKKNSEYELSKGTGQIIGKELAFWPKEQQWASGLQKQNQKNKTNKTKKATSLK